MISIKPPTTIKGLKSQAKKLKRETGCTHTAALELVARSIGFGSYREAKNALPEGGVK